MRRASAASILVLTLGTLVAVAVAGGARAAPATPDLAALLAKYRCEVVDRLQRIHETPDPTDMQNRFLILSRADRPGSYVQCAFDDLDRKMICETASGFFLDAPRSMYLTPTEIAGLHRLGFIGDGATDNFKLTLDIGSPPDLVRVADLMLTAQAIGFDTNARDTLTFKAPDAPEEAERVCGTAV